MSAKLLQLTNTSIGAVAVNANMPLGITTTVYPNYCDCGSQTYSVASSTSDTLVVNKSGTYRIIYNASLVATAAGDIVLSLVINGTTRYTVTTTAVVGGVVNISLPYEVYLPCNCASSLTNIPAYIQLKSTGVAITSGTSNLIISKE